MTLSDLVPSSRRDFAYLLLGSALALGAYVIPGVTIEPEELTVCRVELAEAKAAVDAKTAAAEDLQARVKRCWELRREAEGR